MYARLTGRACDGSVFWCNLSPISYFASGVARPRRRRRRSGPPLARSPAARSTGVLSARTEHQLLQLRTFESPAFDAVKIRCRRPPYVASARRQSMAANRGLVLGPFTATRSPWRLTCPLVPGSRHRLLTGSPDRVSALSRPGTRPVSGQLSETAGWRGRPSCPGFPLPFGRRHSLLGHPMPAGELGPPYGRLTGRPRRVRTSTGLPRSARTSCDRGGCPLYPEDGGAPPGRVVLSRRLPLPAASPCTPPQHPIGGAPLYEASTRVQAIHPSGLPLACSPRMERAALGLSPELRTPPTRSRRRTSRWGQAIEHGPGTTRSTSHQPILQSGSSLVSCDLASHRPTRY